MNVKVNLSYCVSNDFVILLFHFSCRVSLLGYWLYWSFLGLLVPLCDLISCKVIEKSLESDVAENLPQGQNLAINEKTTIVVQSL